jgi:hypothetical protein
MTFRTTTNKTSDAGNGSTTTFSFPYLFFANDDLVVTLVTTATGVEVTQTITTEYAVAGAGNAAGGTVTMVTAPATTETLVIQRIEQFSQRLDLVENDPFPSESVEQQFDILTMLAQQNNEGLGRSLKLPASSGGSGLLGPTTANYLITVNSSNNGFTLVDPSSLGTISAFVTHVTDTFSGNASTTAFVLSSDPASEANTLVTIDGVVQHKATYSLSGTTLNFTTAPPTGTNNIEVTHGQSISSLAIVADTSPQLGGNLDLNGFEITGLVIGTDVQAYDAELQNLADNITADEITQLLNIGTSVLSAAEWAQVAAIGSATITATQWGYLGALDQALATTDDVVFAKMEGIIGSVTPAPGTFTTLSATGAVSFTNSTTALTAVITNSNAAPGGMLRFSQTIAADGTNNVIELLTDNSGVQNFALKDDGAIVTLGALTYGGVTLSAAVTGTGKMVLDDTPTLITPVLGVATGTSFQGIIGNVAPAAGTFTTLESTAVQPILVLEETDAAANNQVWDITALGEQLNFRALNDARNTATSFLTVDRTANTIDLLAFTGTAATFSGTLSATSFQGIIGNVTPAAITGTTGTFTGDIVFGAGPGGTIKGSGGDAIIESGGSGGVIIKTNISTVALTLSNSQDATFVGQIIVDDTTDSTSGTTGSIQTDGGLGVAKQIFAGGNVVLSNAAGPTLLNEAATATNPTLIPNRADPDTGIGWVSANILTLITNGAEALRLDASQNATFVGAISVDDTTNANNGTGSSGLSGSIHTDGGLGVLLDIVTAASLRWGPDAEGLLTSGGNDAYMDASVTGGSLFFRTNGTTQALQLDSSQNATFAGNILASGGDHRFGTMATTPQTGLSPAFQIGDHSQYGQLFLGSGGVGVMMGRDNVLTGDFVLGHLTSAGDTATTEQMRIAVADDLVTFAGSVKLASGKGIDFSATADGSGTTTSELLDDYEEGTWTPDIELGGTAFTSRTLGASNAGVYTKIGNKVFLQGRFQLSAWTLGSGSGTVFINGFPFTTGGGGFSAAAIGFIFNWGTQGPDMMQISTGVTKAQLNYYATTTATAVPAANVGASVDVGFSIHYQV